MGDLKNPKEPPISLLPGFRFHPTEHQLFSFYLCNKNKRNPNLSLPSTSNNHPLFGLDLIRQIDLYNYDPFDLPEISSFSFGHGGSKKHWYYFTVRKTSEDSKRKAKGGFWKCKGRPRNVMGGSEGAVLGTKWAFVFYKGNSSLSLNRTNWVMIEYALVDSRKDSFVLCRVFLKSGRTQRAGHVPRSYGEGSIATTHNIVTDAPCKKLDAPSTSGIGEIVAHGDMLVDKDNEFEKFPSNFTGEPNDVVIAQRVSEGGFGSSLGIPQSNQLEKSSDGLIGSGIGSGIISNEAMVDDDLLTNSTILEGDFIELNDLVCPLVGLDSLG